MDESILFLSPAWVLLDCPPDRLSAYDLDRGSVVELEGDVRRQLFADPPAARRTLASLGRFDRALAQLSEDLARHEPVAFSRAAVLRGSGYGLLFVELTARCNERCLHCYADAGPDQQAELKQDIVEAVLLDARALGFTSVQLTGGDPLLSPVLIPAVQRATDLGFSRIEIFTNGLALHDALLSTLSTWPVSFAFSFYAMRPAIHDAITGIAGSQQRTVRAIERALAAGLPTRVGVIAMRQNAELIDETVSFLRQIGVAQDAIGVSFQRQVGRGELTADRLVASGASTENNASGNGHALRPQGAAPFPGKAAVAADGTVYPCIFGRALVLGNVHQRSLRSILDDPLPLRLDRSVLAGRTGEWSTQMSCGECQLRGALIGGASDPANRCCNGKTA